MYSIKTNSGEDYDNIICYLSFTTYQHIKEHLRKYTELDNNEVLDVALSLASQYNMFSYRRAMCELHGVTFILEKEPS
jgi:hypothetical protein